MILLRRLLAAAILGGVLFVGSGCRDDHYDDFRYDHHGYRDHHHRYESRRHHKFDDDHHRRKFDEDDWEDYLEDRYDD